MTHAWGWFTWVLESFLRWILPTEHYDLTGENNSRVFRVLDLARQRDAHKGGKS